MPSGGNLSAGTNAWSRSGLLQSDLTKHWRVLSLQFIRRTGLCLHRPEQGQAMLKLMPMFGLEKRLSDTVSEWRQTHKAEIVSLSHASALNPLGFCLKSSLMLMAAATLHGINARHDFYSINKHIYCIYYILTSILTNLHIYLDIYLK